ncbi:MAG: MaoC family dehydratase N-terminal domain-containing protein [Candidatus Lambdaproteobacteria bacterium]|nr:MaoC family dehydratase N-terminal domain-containing protein [Candidatus Lambdaproteobacteria bacterium]
MSEQSGPLTDEIRALIGKTAERLPASPPWGIEREGLRIFTNSIMDPDPRYWDDEFAKTTKFGGIITPPIYVSYIGRKTPAGAEDPISRAFRENPESDGIGGVRDQGRQPGALPPIPTPLKRVLNAGNEIELRSYPKLGDCIFSQARYADIKGRIGKDGSPMLIVTTETIYTNQDGEVLCILRASGFRR